MVLEKTECSAEGVAGVFYRIILFAWVARRTLLSSTISYTTTLKQLEVGGKYQRIGKSRCEDNRRQECAKVQSEPEKEW